MLKAENQVFGLGDTNAVGNLAKWTKGSSNLASHLGGICTSVTLRWIKKSIEGGNVTASDQLGGAHSMNIAFGAADMRYAKDGMKGHFNAHGVTPIKESIHSLKSYGTLLNKIADTRGLLCVVLRHSNGSGHCVGFKVSPGKGHSGYQYLDPNVGLFRWSAKDKQAFVDDVAGEMRSTYSSYYDGKYEIYTMHDD